MRHARRLLLLLPLLATGCERYPEDPVFAYGRALKRDGSPMAGATLTLDRAPYLRSWPPAPDYEPDFTPYGTATPGRNGDFTLQVTYGDADASEGDDGEFRQHRFRLTAPLEDGRGTFLSFIFYDDSELPPLQPWEDHLTVEPGAQGPVVSFAPAPPAPELPPSGHYLSTVHGDDLQEEPMVPSTPEPILEVLSGGELLWRQPRVGSPWTPTPYMLEDFAAPEVQLRAQCLGRWLFSPLGGNSSAIDFRQEWRSPRLPLLMGGAPRPISISRGAACQPSPTPECPWTDGQLTSVSFPPMPLPQGDAAPESNRSLVVTLATPARVKRAVLRGLRSTHEFEGEERAMVEGSADGEHWARLGSGLLRDLTQQDAFLDYTFAQFGTESASDSPFGDRRMEQYSEAPAFLDIPLETAEPVRHLRFSVETESSGNIGGVLQSLAEVSLFD